MAKKETKANKKDKNKRSFFKDFKAELKKVVWPTPKQLLNNTVAVITIVLITAAIVLVLDLAFEAVNKHGINKVKEVIGTNNTVSENVSENTTVENTEAEENVSTEDTNVVENTETTEQNAENNAQ